MFSIKLLFSIMYCPKIYYDRLITNERFKIVNESILVRKY